MRKNIRKILAVTIAAGTMISMSACSKTAEPAAQTAAEASASQTEAQTEAPTETLAETSTEAPTEPETEGYDVSWTHNTGLDKVVGDNWGYTETELKNMQWIVDGEKLGYEDFLKATDDQNATWRPMYQKELDDLYDNPLYAIENIPESDWTPEYRDIIKPYLDADSYLGKQVFDHDISRLALRTIFCCTTDHLGLVDGGFAAEHTRVMKDNDSGQEFSRVTNYALEKFAINGVITNAKVLAIDLSPNFSDNNGNYTNLAMASAYIVFNSVLMDDNGKGHDAMNEAVVNLAYVNEDDTDYAHGCWNVDSFMIGDRIDTSQYMVKASTTAADDESEMTIYSGDNHDWEEKTLRTDVYGTETYTK